MVTDTMTKPHNLIASDRVEGTAVRRPNGERLGHIERLMIDKVTGQVSYAVLSFGGFLGMGEKDVAVPFSSVSASEKNNKWYLVLNTTKEALKTAPGFTYDKAKTAWIPAAK